jgi:4-amino-4-deoxy-L-arabinose transferase-like glycosyltransferase
LYSGTLGFLVRTRSAVLLLVLVTALPRLGALLYERGAILVQNVEKGDVFARTFLSTGTYGFIPGHPSAYTQPLYGWFLIPLYWIFGRHWIVVGVAQVAIACATTLVVWQIGRRWLSPGAGLLAGLVVAVHPYLVWHDIHMNREILDQLLAASAVFLTLLALERLAPWRLAALGAVLGLAILGNVRLEALPFVLLAYLFVARRQVAWVGAAALLAACAVVVMPWVVRNAADVGCWTVTTDARALWKANNVNTYATLKSGQWIDHVPQPKSFPPTPQDVYERWTRTGVVQPYDECAQMSTFQRKVLSFWVHHPGEKARIMPIDMQWLWQPSVVDVTDRPGQGTWLDTMRFLAEPTYMIVLYVLAAIGLFLVPRRFAALALVLLAYQTATAALFVGETRYRVPWDFLVALLASYAALRIPSTWSELVSARRLRTSSRS